MYATHQIFIRLPTGKTTTHLPAETKAATFIDFSINFTFLVGSHNFYELNTLAPSLNFINKLCVKGLSSISNEISQQIAFFPASAGLSVILFCFPFTLKTNHLPANCGHNVI
jgi:hypothetical protein